MMNGAASVIMAEELEALKKKIVAQHFGAGQKASGRTAASLRVEVSENEGTLYGRSPFGTLETGRRPGKTPRGFQAIIRKWMADKGIEASPIPYKTDRPHKYTPQERGELSLSFLIARKIKKNGTSLFRKGGRADIYSNVIPQATERIKSRVVELLKLDVDNIKLNNVEA